ncbi:hypothetical protein [Bradyrhizobium sp. Leo121]|uniref:hypothetical protein n=1 Tax=Bradyrhizobium sp. Leo121 TaxID=1571195 RepID=UPI0010295AD6|nr:hypothetical protein [Bradyrhizobium sp. Leo121]
MIASSENCWRFFFACDIEKKAAKLAGVVRTRLGQKLGLLTKDVFEFCWIVDFSMYESPICTSIRSR